MSGADHLRTAETDRDVLREVALADLDLDGPEALVERGAIAASSSPRVDHAEAVIGRQRRGSPPSSRPSGQSAARASASQSAMSRPETAMPIRPCQPSRRKRRSNSPSARPARPRPFSSASDFLDEAPSGRERHRRVGEDVGAADDALLVAHVDQHQRGGLIVPTAVRTARCSGTTTGRARRLRIVRCSLLMGSDRLELTGTRHGFNRSQLTGLQHRAGREQRRGRLRIRIVTSGRWGGIPVQHEQLPNGEKKRHTEGEGTAGSTWMSGCITFASQLMHQTYLLRRPWSSAKPYPSPTPPKRSTVSGVKRNAVRKSSMP